MVYSGDERKRLKKYHPGCLNGKHVPVAGVDKHNRIIEVFCQHCFIEMTKEEHREYFKNYARPDISNINYEETGDPMDVDTASPTT